MNPVTDAEIFHRWMLPHGAATTGQQKLSSKQAIHQAHHPMDGRPAGKLLPRFAGPIAAHLLAPRPKPRRPARLHPLAEKTVLEGDLPGGGGRSEEGPLASAAHDQRGGAGGGAG
jgi:hypothetical protein